MTIPQGGVYDITIYQGADYSETFQLTESDDITPIPLTGFAAKAQVRAKAGAAGAPLAEFATAVDEAEGKVTLALNAAATTALTAPAFYDVFLTGPETLLFLQGRVTVDKRVTVV
jgi:hypothetical protein